MPRNLTHKLIASRLVAGQLERGKDVTVSVDQVLLEDATGTMAAMQFEMLDLDSIAIPLAVMYVDHNVLQIDDKNMQDHRYLQSFCKRYGLHYSPPGHGISHYIHLERFAKPGTLLVGADSHTSSAGALGMLAIGAGGLEVALAMGGFGFSFVMPKVVGVRLDGVLRPGVEAKDIVLELLRRLGVRGGLNTIVEFHGPGVAELSVTARATICNMIVETGATTAVFPSDDRALQWLAAQGRHEDFVPLSADDGAAYDDEIAIVLDELVALVALPHSPGNVIRVRDIEPTPLVQVCIGSSVNSSYEDLATVAALLEGKRVHPGIQLTVTPGSRQVLQSIIQAGIYESLMRSGARMLEPICGPCVGIGQAPIAGGASLRTFNRNFPGRSGTVEDNVFLCSPTTAAMSALAGAITEGRIDEPLHFAPAPEPDLSIHSAIEEPLPASERGRVVIERGSNLVPPRIPDVLPDSLRGKTLIVVGDDVSTGDMAPDGVLAMSVWSNIPVCSTFMFSRIDPGFHDRALTAGGGFIVGGENYGQGSSREHAALVPAHLGVHAVIARSFARIHRRNLIAAGVVPLTLRDDTVIETGGTWEIDGLSDAIAGGLTEISARYEGIDIRLGIDLTPGERAILGAGGLIQLARADRIPRVQ